MIFLTDFLLNKNQDQIYSENKYLIPSFWYF